MEMRGIARSCIWITLEVGAVTGAGPRKTQSHARMKEAKLYNFSWSATFTGKPLGTPRVGEHSYINIDWVRVLRDDWLHGNVIGGTGR